MTASAPVQQDHTQRGADPRLADLTVPEFRRIAVTAALFAVVLTMFLWMVREVLVAAFLGLVIAVYMRPLYRWTLERVRAPAAAAVFALSALILPVLALLAYSYVEIGGAAEYLAAHEVEIAARINAAFRQIPFLHDADISRGVRRLVAVASDYGARLPRVIGRLVVQLAVSAAVFLFTAFYVFTDTPGIVGYVRNHIPRQYTELAHALGGNARGVLYGAVYATLVTQTIKSVIMFGLLIVFGVPLAAVLALVSFVIGFFPVVGSWTVYLPVAAWLLIFRDAPVSALLMVAIGFSINTVFLSMYLRPKLAADRSQVLNFYWMFLGLITGVYTFGLAGILLGPILIGLLKAVVETIKTGTGWRLPSGAVSAP